MSGRNSSKGNQHKWYADGYWYKEDGLGYEALAEVLVSRLLPKTNITLFVAYEYEPIVKNGQSAHGCRSRDFMNLEDDKIVSVERLFQTYRGVSAAKDILQYDDTGDRIRYVAESVEAFTGLAGFGVYLKHMLTVDALFLNEDRHFHNIAVIRRKDGSYRECPIFDNGAALFSDMLGDYPLEMELDDCYKRQQAKPFSRDFEEQLDACELLYGEKRFRAMFTVKDLEQILREFSGIYEEKILRRVYEVMRWQMRKYGYLFSC